MVHQADVFHSAKGLKVSTCILNAVKATILSLYAWADVCIACHKTLLLAQAVLVSKFQSQDAGSQTSDSLLKAVNVCDKFLTRAQGTPAELDVLKSQVRLTLAQQVRPRHFCTCSEVTDMLSPLS